MKQNTAAIPAVIGSRQRARQIRLRNGLGVIVQNEPGYAKGAVTREQTHKIIASSGPIDTQAWPIVLSK
jgi:hypothetical protein